VDSLLKNAEKRLKHAYSDPHIWGPKYAGAYIYMVLPATGPCERPGSRQSTCLSPWAGSAKHNLQVTLLPKRPAVLPAWTIPNIHRHYYYYYIHTN